ncbi:glycine--tRNA ligase subunit beta [Planktomarina sp.]|uniref:glycine--tRNA ligase subunit beta n=1 Tax=Planktomarina sp. TaxID=2024851 RepID=UPI00288F527D|nr:glycine--tRNA ligase subunit beta [Planktomarina sp.]
MADLLIELFSEEIPAGLQAPAAENLKKLLTNGMVEAGLTYANASAFYTARRLTLVVEGLLDASPTVQEERKGPKVGAPEQAISGFLRGAGLTMDDLEVRDDKKGQVYFAKITKPGRAAPEIVAEVLEATIRNFPWPKSMRWGLGSLRWVRPLQSILCVLSNNAEISVVPLEVDGIKAGNQTRGHRFMASDAFSVSGFEDYETKLKLAKVILRADERQVAIWQEAQTQAFALGQSVVEDTGLLAELAGLVEWPVVLMGQIDEDFLDLPPEVLKTSMKEHQKFFSVLNPKTGRIERFVTVANIEAADQGATILKGNQKVLAARLADAKFFWENDLREAKAGMGNWQAALENVTFHNKLGSQAARIKRIAALARELAPVVGANPDTAEQAALVAKADLSSEMVYEFPELQGLMGRYYAAKAGMSAEIAAACEAHYSPLGPSDDVPTAPVSVAVGLADKLDTLSGFWAIDEKPTGSKDPFALRRAALGVIRLILENHLTLPLADKLTSADAGAGAADLLGFFQDRLKTYLRHRGIRHDVIDACIAMPQSDDLALLVKRAEALQGALATDDGENLIQGFKRASNILIQAEENDRVEYSFGADVKYAENEVEKVLFAALDEADKKIQPAMAAQDFAAAMAAMATLRGPIDEFFEAVKINADSALVRRNRLNLLSRIRTTCLSVVDLTKVEG